MLRIRPATPSDADGLAASVVEGLESYRSFAPEDWKVPDPLELALGIAVRLHDEEQRTWVAEDDDGEIAGQVAYVPAARSLHPIRDPQLAHLGQLFVRPPHWGTGLAARLLDVAVAEAGASGFTAMRLFTPTDHARARRFYEREGWTIRDEPAPDHPLGLALVEYRRTLET